MQMYRHGNGRHTHVLVNVHKSLYLIYTFTLQTMDHLKVLLEQSRVNYTERRFLTEQGVAGLGDEIFVSLHTIYSVMEICSLSFL